MSHTPTPWYVGYSGNDYSILMNSISVDTENTIASMARTGNAYDDSMFIALACNSHDALVAFIEKALPIVDSDLGFRGYGADLVEEGNSLLEKIKGAKQ